MPITASPKMNTTTNPMMTSTCKTCKRWGLPCPVCVKSTLHPSPKESDWSDETWDGDRQRGRGGAEEEIDCNITIAANTTTTAAYTDVDHLLDTEMVPICKLCKTIGDPCPFVIKPDQPPSHLKSEDWTKDEEKNSRKNKVSNDYHPSRPVHNPTFKQDPLPHYTLKEKLAMDLDYYSPKLHPRRRQCPLPS